MGETSKILLAVGGAALVVFLVTRNMGGGDRFAPPPAPAPPAPPPAPYGFGWPMPYSPPAPGFGGGGSRGDGGWGEVASTGIREGIGLVKDLIREFA